jgi:geranylgeranyl pyrophosphate synthase
VLDLENFFNEVRNIVDLKLDRLMPLGITEPLRLYEAIRWSLFGEGKRFRPALVIAAGREFGAPDEKLVHTAAAVEMIHTYSLIHDDLPAMDDDDLRRGRATVHKKFDVATAILAGDALQAMAFGTIAGDESLDQWMRLRLISELSMAAGQMVAGQQLDLEAEGKKVELDEVEQIHKGKTGALITFSVRAGGIIAEVSERNLLMLTNFGGRLGLLFQITDDILDVTSTSETLGKTAGKDIASRKATYPEAIGLAGACSLAKRIGAEAYNVLGPICREDSLLHDICNFVATRNS